MLFWLVKGDWSLLLESCILDLGFRVAGAGEFQVCVLTRLFEDQGVSPPTAQPFQFAVGSSKRPRINQFAGTLGAWDHSESK